MKRSEKKEVIKNAVELLSKVIDLKSLKFAPSEETIVEFSFGLFIERTYRSLKSLNLLIQIDDQELDNSIGLISRSILSDFFLVFSLVELGTTDAKSIANDLKVIFEKTAEEINKLIIILEKYPHYPKDMINNVRDVNSSRLKLLGNPTGDKRKFETTSIVKEITKSSIIDSKCKRFPIQAFDIWKLLSQYEHFGHYYFYISKSNNKEQIDRSIIILEFAFYIISQSLAIIIEITKRKDLELSLVEIKNFLIEKILTWRQK